MCLAVVASCSLTQEVAGSSPFNDTYFLLLNSVKTFRKNFNEKKVRTAHLRSIREFELPRENNRTDFYYFLFLSNSLQNIVYFLCVLFNANKTIKYF